MSKLIAGPTAAELIQSVVRAFVDSPALVSIEEVSNQRGSTLFLRVDAADIGKVIGNQGQMETALKDILRARSVKMKHRYVLEILDDFDVNLQ
jgi:uncharacterized protein